jgi:hypothetical protein
MVEVTMNVTMRIGKKVKCLNAEAVAADVIAEADICKNFERGVCPFP